MLIDSYQGLTNRNKNTVDRFLRDTVVVSVHTRNIGGQGLPMIKNKQKGFALVLSLVLLLVMSLMGGGLVVIASSDHEGNNSNDPINKHFMLPKLPPMQAEKSLIDKGPLDFHQE